MGSLTTILAHSRPGTTLSPFITEIATVIGLVAAAIYVDTSVLSFLSSAHPSDFGVSGIDQLSGLLNAFRHSVLTFIFLTELSPEAAPGKLFVLVVSLQGVAILMVAVVLFWRFALGRRNAS